MRRDTWIGFAVVIGLAAVLASVWILRPDDSLPEAAGRKGDACTATGPVGLVGLDAASGEERWTNVVGTDVANVWTPGPDGDVTSGESADVFVIGDEGRVRRVAASSGAVEACTSIRKLSATEIGRPIAVDGSGALARDRTTSAVEVVEADGSSRWVQEGRTLVAASEGGIATQTNLGYEPGPPRLAVEVLDPERGEVRWAKEVGGLSAVATATHLVVVDQFGVDPDSYPASPDDAGRQVARVTAYDLADGAEAWHVDVDGTPEVTFADAGLILVPGGDGGPTLTAVDDTTGAVRWTRPLPEPGRGGDDTELGGIDGAAVAGDVVVVAVRSAPPYRD